MTRKHLSLSRTLCSVLAEIGRQDHRTLSNLIEHGMREWISVEIHADRYRHLETGPIMPPGPYRVDPEAMQQNKMPKPRQPVPPVEPLKGTKTNNQYTDGSYLRSLEAKRKKRNSDNP
jgi:hypothetical protein